jgi:hypothetical protein
VQITSKGQVTVPQEIRNRLLARIRNAGEYPSNPVGQTIAVCGLPIAANRYASPRRRQKTIACATGDNGHSAWLRPLGRLPQTKRGVLVDSNVLLDIATNDPHWGGWAGRALSEAAEHTTLIVNPIVYAEVSIGYTTIEALDAARYRNYFPKLEILAPALYAGL